MDDPENSGPGKAKVVTPVPKRAPRKGAPPPREDTLGALPENNTPRDRKRRDKDQDKDAKDVPGKAIRKERTEPLNFRVTADFRRAFKRAAAAQDCKKVELLERIFVEWSDRNPV
jgi:hypothetical protein